MARLAALAGVQGMSKLPHHIKKAAQDPSLGITVRIGKGGLSESILEELSSQLDARNLVKIKINRGIFSKPDKALAIKMICEKCNAILVEAKGNVLIVYRP